MDFFEILPYTSESLANALHHPNFTSVETIKSNKHFHYLCEYIGEIVGLNAKSLIVENEYISKNYLIDYSTFYATCFTNYPKICKRIHVFSCEISEKEFNGFIINNDKSLNDKYNQNYLGNIVVKPLPNKVIGTSILKPYPKEIDGNYKRVFFGIRKYDVHLFGGKLSIDSLAYQEQDGAVSACATVAIWSVLQSTNKLFGTLLKTPAEITDDAGILGSDGDRLFPNKGLEITQICNALTKAGLVVEIRHGTEYLNCSEIKKELKGNWEILQKEEWIDAISENSVPILTNDYLAKLIYAYSFIQVPIILTILVPDGDDYGEHAVTISGYRISTNCKIKSKKEITWKAASIDKIYAHDDQWGPFARMHFKGNFSLDSMWSVNNEFLKEGNLEKLRLPTFATTAIIPLYHKIRISYDDIEKVIESFDKLFWIIFEDKLEGDIVWEIKLIKSQTYKEEVKNNVTNAEIKTNFLCSNLPKYIWLASCTSVNIMLIDFVFDATEIPSAMCCIHVLWNDDEFSRYVADYINANEQIKESHTQKNIQYIEYLVNEIDRLLDK